MGATTLRILLVKVTIVISSVVEKVVYNFTAVDAFMGHIVGMPGSPGPR